MLDVLITENQEVLFYYYVKVIIKINPSYIVFIAILVNKENFIFFAGLNEMIHIIPLLLNLLPWQFEILCKVIQKHFEWGLEALTNKHFFTILVDDEEVWVRGDTVIFFVFENNF